MATHLDLLWEGALSHPAVDGVGAYTRHIPYFGKTKEAGSGLVPDGMTTEGRALMTELFLSVS